MIAETVKDCGAALMRGGAFKPRTSPYAFQGLKEVGIDYLLEAKANTDMPIVTELMSISDLDLFEQVDVIQVGARNMQNFAMLRELGHLRKPILLKRGLANTIEELLMSAEFESATRNTLDISAIPVLKKLTHLPVIVDPSHASGHAAYVEALSLASVAAGADGLIIEVHNNPQKALCDGAQSLDFEAFAGLMKKVSSLRACMQTCN